MIAGSISINVTIKIYSVVIKINSLVVKINYVAADISSETVQSII